MALTTVNATVTDIKTGTFGTGLKLAEEFKVGQQTYKRNWMAWFKDSQNVAVGATITVTGSLTVKMARDPQTKLLRSYIDKTTNESIPYIDFALNDCVIDPAW